MGRGTTRRHGDTETRREIISLELNDLTIRRINDFYDLQLTARSALSLPVQGIVPGSLSNGSKGSPLTANE
jgi:hypothetical protein